MLAFPSNHYKDKIRSRKSTPKLSAYDHAVHPQRDSDLKRN